MEDLRKVYPQLAKDAKGDGSFFYGPSDYIPMIKSMGHGIAGIFEAGHYQGDSYIFFERSGDHAIGFLSFGYGSCSGCDPLQATESFTELEQMRDSFCSKIVWKDNWEDMIFHLEYMKANPELYWESNEDTFKAVVTCVNVLAGSSDTFSVKWNLEDEFYERDVIPYVEKAEED